MKTRQFFFLTSVLAAVFTLQSCKRSSSDVWEDTKSAGRHMGRGVRALGGNHENSRQIRSRNDFECIEDENCCPEGNFQDCCYQDTSNNQDYYTPQDFYSPTDSYTISQDSYYGNNASANNDFIPLQDPTNELAMSDMMAPPLVKRRENKEVLFQAFKHFAIPVLILS